VKGEVPQAILEAILKEVTALEQVGPDEVAIERAESVVGTTARWDARNQEWRTPKLWLRAIG
jgi:hypothetical protein